MTTKEIIGKNLAFLRDKMELTQEEVANYLGVNRVEVSYFENGQRPVSMDHLLRLGDLYGVETEDLYQETLKENYKQPVSAFRALELKTEDLKSIAEFRRIVKNYKKMKELVNKTKA